MAKRIKDWVFRLTPWALLIWLLSMMAVIWYGYALYKASQYHQHLRQKTLQSDSSADAVFANGFYLSEKKDTENALKQYALAASSNDVNIRKVAHYNMANIYLRQAYLILDEKGYDEWDKVTPLLSLAKEGYKEALRLSPNWVEAKYNAELAFRLAPNIESKSSSRSDEEEENIDEKPPEGWPAIPGFPRGMP
ncbi:MAG: hypothetical protein V9G21_00065 [Methylotenera sp.]|jgi:mxaK protein|nr:hypothetical protein [Methylotenera sp.]HPH07893.1 hypothetical protein [Methylotenera sp.]HPM50022.1 hypothetical protein [Methylotenera sp.]